MTDQKKRSDIISSSPSPVMNMFRQGLLHGAGYSSERIASRPLIAIANSHTDLTTGHSHLGMLAARVREQRARMAREVEAKDEALQQKIRAGQG